MAIRNRWLIGTAVLALAVFATMWLGYQLHWSWLTELDDTALAAAYSYGVARPGWVTAWDVFCTVLGPLGFRLVGLAIIVAALVRRRYRVALFLVLTVELSGIVTELVKALVDRPRPDTAMVYALSSSFPSGHALGVMVSVLALLCFAWPVLSARARGWLCVLGAVVIGLIGVGRVVLNVHHPSDVMAGWALGYAYFVLCVLLAPPYPVRAADETPAALDSAR
ncbi:phosphatase PAP2 family protein [Mycolicibacterium mageritense]